MQTPPKETAAVAEVTSPPSPPSPLPLGPLLSRSFAHLKAEPALFLWLTLFITLPTALASGLAPKTQELIGGMILGQMIMAYIFEGAFAYALYQIRRGNATSLKNSIALGMERLFPILCIAVISVCGFILGGILLIIPGLIITTIWSVAIPACAVERLGVIDSLKRSAQLTKGNRTRLLLLFLALAIALALLSYGLETVLLMLIDSLLAASLLKWAVQLLPSAFIYVVGVTIYYDLKALKAGTSADPFAKVFD